MVGRSPGCEMKLSVKSKMVVDRCQKNLTIQKKFKMVDVEVSEIENGGL